MTKGFLKSYRFCPLCGTGLRLKSEHRDSPKRLICQICGFIFYQNSRPAVGAIIEKDGKILLAKRACAPCQGEWDIPGGFLEAGEHPLKGLKREIKEEANIEIYNEKFFGFYIDRYWVPIKNEFTLNIFYTAGIKGGKITAKDDVAQFHWFPINKLPPLAFENGRKALEDYVHKTKFLSKLHATSI